jgi:OmpA-OmpF porin, OOP family
VRFEFNHSDLKSPADLSTNQYAALLKDPRCESLKVTVAGHADWKGTEAYNQALSERRAQSVIAALEAAGVAVGRLTGVGYSEDKPLDPALDDSARMKNRRVEFTVTQ